MQVDGSTKLVGVFGSPIRHTASPAMHNAAFAALGLNWAYLAFPVEPRNLRAALRGARDLGLIGVNLTVPHKILALELMDAVAPEASQLGAVNTVVFKKGKMHGFNTDGYGFTQAIRDDFGLRLRGKRVLVIGAGGAGRAIAVQCARQGAELVYVTNRTVAKIKPIGRMVKQLGRKFEPVPLDRAALARIAGDLDLVVNATSVGLRAGESLGLGPELFATRPAVYDTIYRPAQTELLRVAAAAGARTANGLSMLLHQGARAFEIWTGKPAPVAVMRQALQTAIDGDRL